MTSSLDDIEPTAYNNMEADEEYCRRNDIHDLSSVVGDAFSQGVPDMDGQTTDSSKDPEPNSEDKKAFPPSSGSFFSPNLQGQRKKVLLKFVFTNCLLAIICFTMFVLFWGALYDTSKYLHKVKLLVVIQEPCGNFG
ncbi:CPA_1a_G0030230.mRNA.1.CDS.1 [Saccharomyces cerevisiae]|nr:CPA_1a_G0030230.mRNA.1.CDS.1 [Saccharomyces cerevisiae]CAI4561223.1 BBM_1a_G0029700.mRNA.1.CDS.1 [Saccharomyces cerevisiae]CAI7178494.1 BBM_1a_G0029700.mRNA.1.CDS.1 [Saccharomyces cerevisiae]CAI7364111.1 CPA_1a_G0030230.mRNA.1.CDS.1 [Saccharomyces cerevisiae]